MTENSLTLEKDFEAIINLLKSKKKEKRYCVIIIKIQNGNIQDVDVTDKYKIYNLIEYYENKNFSITI